MFTIWCWAIRPLPSVNGIVKTSGSVPAASAAVKVGAVQLYSSGSTVIQGYLASNSLICSFSASTASWVAPGRRTPTMIVTGSWALPWLAAADVRRWRPATRLVDGLGEAAELQAASRVAATTARAARTDAGRRVVDLIGCSPLTLFTRRVDLGGPPIGLAS